MNHIPPLETQTQLTLLLEAAGPLHVRAGEHVDGGQEICSCNDSDTEAMPKPATSPAIESWLNGMRFDLKDLRNGCVLPMNYVTSALVKRWQPFERAAHAKAQI